MILVKLVKIIVKILRPKLKLFHIPVEKFIGRIDGFRIRIMDTDLLSNTLELIQKLGEMKNVHVVAVKSINYVALKKILV